MSRAKLWVAVIGIVLTAVATSFADDQAANPDAAMPPQMKLPPGWTMEDMQACMVAAAPGKMQQLLAKDAGEWRGKCTMWMAPDTEPMTSNCSSLITPIMDGRFVKIEMNGEMPGMGPFSGMGINGYDNVAQKFNSTWVDNHSSGIMNGTGDLSADGKTLTWNYTMSCPITKKPTTIRQVETSVDDNTKKIEMFGDDPKTGKEFKMMSFGVHAQQVTTRARF